MAATPQAGRAGGRPPAWAWIAAAAAAAAAAAILWRAIAAGGDARFADEGYYVDYVRLVAERGPAAFPRLFERYLGDERHWQFPNPLRLGYIACGALWSTPFERVFPALRWMSVAAHLATVVVAWLLARRALGELGGVLVAWSVACSPILSMLGQRALTGSFTVAWTTLAIWSFREHVHRPGGWRLALAAATWTGALLAKETSVLLLVPFGAYAAWTLRARSGVGDAGEGRASAPSLLALLAVPPLLVGALQAWAAGGPGELARLARIVVASPETNEYAQMYGSGPWYQYAVDFLVLSPATFLLALAGVAFAVRARLRHEDVGARDYLVVVLVGLWAAFALFTKNVRYAAVLDVPLRVFAVAGLLELVRPRDPRVAAAAQCAIVLAVCVADWSSLHVLFLDRPLNDPTTTWLLGGRDIVPLAR